MARIVLIFFKSQTISTFLHKKNLLYVGKIDRSDWE